MSDSELTLTCKRCGLRFRRASLWRSRHWPIPLPHKLCLRCYELLMSAPPPTTTEGTPPAKPSFVPLPDCVVRFNGGARCDMEQGPCSCGATHDSGATTEGTLTDGK